MKFNNFKNKILIFLISLFLIIFIIFFKAEIKNFFYLVSSPIQKIFWQGGKEISDFLKFISEIRELKKENENLKIEIKNLLAENVYLKELEKENEVLRGALNLELKKDFTLNLVQVIGKEINQDSLIIDKGSKDGILKGLPVITKEKILVGKISEVYQNFSKVDLISNKEISFDAKTSETEVLGLVKGKGNLKISFELIPKEKEIKIGEKIVTTALGGNFPPGLLVGEIEKIKKSDIAPFQEAELKKFFSLEDLDFLFVILKW